MGLELKNVSSILFPSFEVGEGTCHEGDGVRLHKKCDKICDRPLVCGHTCKGKSGLPWMVLFS